LELIELRQKRKIASLEKIASGKPALKSVFIRTVERKL
jgi:hypothetical protein